MENKICTKCHQSKPMDSFYRNGNRYGKQEYKSQCSNCIKLGLKRYGNSRYIKYKMNNPIKDVASQAVRSLVATGKIIKPDQCSICLSIVGSKSIQGHHEDYSKPLEVIWVCVKCHSNIHRTKKLLI